MKTLSFVLQTLVCLLLAFGFLLLDSHNKLIREIQTQATLDQSRGIIYGKILQSHDALHLTILKAGAKQQAQVHANTTRIEALEARPAPVCEQPHIEVYPEGTFTLPYMVTNAWPVFEAPIIEWSNLIWTITNLPTDGILFDE
jgi:hypothetical protein